MQNDDLDSIREIFLLHKDSKNEILYFRYLTFAVESNKIDKEYDLTYVKEAISLFPDNDKFPVLLPLIENGIDNIIKANNYSAQAREFYNNNDFQKALEFYQKAEELLPHEPAYKENIATTYLQMKDYENALKYYNIVIDSFNLKTGRPEYLKGYLYVELKKRLLACEAFEASVRFNNDTGRQFLAKYCN